MHRRVQLLLLTAGWGANHFATLLLVYRRELGFSAAQLGAPLRRLRAWSGARSPARGGVSDERGRRAVVLPASFLAIAASILLAFGGHGFGVLLGGRLLYGLAMGSVMSPGSVWVTELSSVEAGPRRATLALSAGFGLGPLVSAVVVELAPAPMVLPYVAHAAVMAVSVMRARSVPDTAGRGASATKTPPRHLSVRELGVLAELLPVAPWAFGLAAVAIAIVPGIMRQHVAHPVLYSGLVIMTTLLTGVLVQPLTKRFGARGDLVGLATRRRRHRARAYAVRIGSPALVFVVAVLLGTGYGLVITTGLREVQRRASEGARGTAVASTTCSRTSASHCPSCTPSSRKTHGDAAMLLYHGACCAAVIDRARSRLASLAGSCRDLKPWLPARRAGASSFACCVISRSSSSPRSSSRSPTDGTPSASARAASGSRACSTPRSGSGRRSSIRSRSTTIGGAR